MHLSDFRLHRPQTLAEACRAAQDLGPEACFLAGGTDLLVDLKHGRRTARDVVALAGLAELHGIRQDGATLVLGALTTMEELAESPLVRAAAPALAEAAQAVGSVQIRSRATIGGNFCAAVPCAETPPACIALGGSVRLATAAGERVLSAEDFFSGPRATLLAKGELLKEILVPARKPGEGSAYLRHGRRLNTSLAVAGAAVFVAVQGGRIARARVALTSVAPTPLFARNASKALEGQPAGAAALAEAAAAAAAECKPIDDLRGSAQFRRDLVDALVRRAGEAALRSAQ